MADGKQPLSVEELDGMFKESEEQRQEENKKSNDRIIQQSRVKIFQWSIKVIL